MYKRLLLILAVTVFGCGCFESHYLSNPVAFSVHSERGELFWLEQMHATSVRYEEPMSYFDRFATDYEVHIKEESGDDAGIGTIYSVVVLEKKDRGRGSSLFDDKSDAEYVFVDSTVIIDREGNTSDVATRIFHWMVEDVCGPRGEASLMDPYWYNSAVREAVESGDLPKRFEDRMDLDYSVYEEWNAFKPFEPYKDPCE